MQIASYFASLGFRVDKKDLKQVDSSLKLMETKLKKFGKKVDKHLRITIDVNKFNVDQKRLNSVLGNALDLASNKITFEISRFSVNNRNLQAAIMRASKAGGNISLAEDRAAMLRHIQGRGVGNTTYVQRSLSPEEWNRREGVKNEEWNRRRREIRADQEARLAARRARSPQLGRSAAFGGGVGGGLSRAYAPAIALGLGGYGLGALNRRNQEVVSAQLMTQAVVQQAGGTQQQGVQSFDWLRGQANRIGFNYLEAAPDFNKLLSGLTGAGMTVGQGQQVFKGFAELSRVNKLDKTSQNRLFRALAQVAGKNQLMSEELTGQIAEALPGGTALFAQAYQRKIGGKLQGTEAIQALRDAMEKRLVKGDILTYAGQIASEKAAVGLPAASKASQAEQQRFQNALNDQAIIASQAGVESGFTKLFRALAIGLNESTGLTKRLADTFDSAATFAEKLILFPQSFMRALEGRDSLVADWLGYDDTEKLKEDWAIISAAIDQIFSKGEPEWMVTFKSTAQEIAAIMGKIAEFQQWRQRTTATAEQIISDEYYAGGGSTQSQIKGVLKAGWHTAKSIFTGSDESARYMAQRAAYEGEDISPYMGPMGFEPDKFWKAQAESNKMEAVKRFGQEGLGISSATAGTYIAEAKNENKFDIQVMLQTDNVDEFREYFNTEFTSALDTALLNFNQKE